MSLSSSAIDKIAFEKGLPANIDAERFILGSVLLNDARFIEIAGSIVEDDFQLEKHRRIFSRMMQLHERGETIDRVTVANELQRYNELQAVDGLIVPHLARRRPAAYLEPRQLRQDRSRQGHAAPHRLPRSIL